MYKGKYIYIKKNINVWKKMQTFKKKYKYVKEDINI